MEMAEWREWFTFVRTDGTSGPRVATDRVWLTHAQDRQLALLTLVFPDSVSNGAPADLPTASALPYLNNASAALLPSSKNLLTPISSEKTLAVSMDYDLAPKFLQSVRELPCALRLPTRDAYGNNVDEKRWMMSALKGDSAVQQRSFSRRASDAWTAFVDVLKVRGA